MLTEMVSAPYLFCTQSITSHSFHFSIFPLPSPSRFPVMCICFFLFFQVRDKRCEHARKKSLEIVTEHPTFLGCSKFFIRDIERRQFSTNKDKTLCGKPHFSLLKRKIYLFGETPKMKARRNSIFFQGKRYVAV